MDYRHMSQMAASGMKAGEGHACGCGAPVQQACTFARPPPARVYCHPAPFSSDRDYHRLVDAYGHSIPSKSHY